MATGRAIHVNQKPVILIVGASGQVGTELQRSFADAGDVTAWERSVADLFHPETLRSLIRQLRPALILNAAAYTAVDRAESEVDQAMTINADAPRVLAEEAARLDATLVHYSTDYVFDGSKKSPWVENDKPNPLNVYGRTKLAGERAIQEVGGKYLIFRTSWVYGPHGQNFLRTMLRLGRERDQLKIVNDQFGAPTSSLVIANATRAAWDKTLTITPEYGVYHLTCAGETTWYGFAQEIFTQHQKRTGEKIPQLTPIPSSEYPTPATRPVNSVLSNEKLQSTFGITLPDWRLALAKVMGK
ncbi:dTDP-4-dehydrorhamnose reductase [Alloacidobacterium dinghuense]|uniref:dTDP-4-dehydrorhamnose reductase n=1 Tax=Alloacidobacterium dinghuense TaxID=2763107 RepID=A0A7G8BIJ4_9BACT|nr:dTDP-4-dehydrorhamnose reductase [Alloacidobacterium dinghuense]QNI32364.1 dTDP-4-dehydrorhamnose reductase [Alloacidobacterium dinghuense]